MNLEKIKQAIELTKLIDGDVCVTDFPEPVGQCVFIRTVTMYYTGRIKKICGGYVTLEEAAWIPDCGRFYDFLHDGKGNEVEPFIDDVHIPEGSIIDVTKWRHKLLKDKK